MIIVQWYIYRVSESIHYCAVVYTCIYMYIQSLRVNTLHMHMKV